MKKRFNRIKEAIKASDKLSLWVYVILRLLIILCLVRELFNGNYEKIFKRQPSKMNEKQMQLYTKALNSCSQILEKLNKEMKIYE